MGTFPLNFCYFFLFPKFSGNFSFDFLSVLKFVSYGITPGGGTLLTQMGFTVFNFGVIQYMGMKYPDDLEYRLALASWINKRIIWLSRKDRGTLKEQEKIFKWLWQMKAKEDDTK